MKLLLCLLLLLLASSSTTAQFTCSISATDEDTCLSQTDGSSDHCVWCALSSFGFCVSEKQAESMEQNIPGVECDRYSPTPGDDDAAPDADDDGNIAPTDDAIPDDFWMCLQDKTEKACLSQNCTWCDTKAGFGLCMTGPTADSAADSDWFECTRPGDDDKSSSSSSSDSSSSEDKEQDTSQEEGEVLMVKEEEEKEDTILTPYDPSCIAAFFTGDQTKESCVAAVDMEGGACEFCTLPGSAAAGSSLCLTQEQAGIAIQLGITCEDDAQQLDLTVLNPYDPACELAFLQDPTKEACVAAVDQDGGACEYCTLQANSDVTMCLTQEQAEIAEQIGVECEEQQIVNVQDFLNDPYDTSCVLAYLEDQTEEGCKAAVDQDGRPCEWCDLQGMTNLCLNEDQADMAAQLGVTCEKTDTEEMDKEEEQQQQLRGGGDENYDSVVLTA